MTKFETLSTRLKSKLGTYPSTLGTYSSTCGSEQVERGGHTSALNPELWGAFM